MNDTDKKDIFINVNEIWTQHNCVITTPIVESGLSYDIAGHFHKVYSMVSSGSTHPRGLLQCLGRIRNLECNEIHILAKNMILHERVDFFTYKEIERNLETVYEMKKYEDILLYDEKITIHKDENYKVNFIFNQVELYNKSSYYFLSYLKLLCKEKGYEFTYDEEKSKDKTKKLIKNKQNSKIYTLLDCKCPTQEEYYDIKHKIEISKATEEEKIKFKKYITFVSDLSYDMVKIKTIEKEFENKKKDEREYNMKNESDIEDYYKTYPNLAECEKELKCVKFAKNYCCLLNIKNLNKDLLNKNIDGNLESMKYLKKLDDIFEFINLFENVDISKKSELVNFTEIIKKNLQINLFGVDYSNKRKKENNKDKSIKEIMGHLNVILSDYGLVLYVKQKTVRPQKCIKLYK